MRRISKLGMGAMLLVSLSIAVYGSNWKKCAETQTKTVGQCTGQAPCTGSVTRTEYQGCKDCVSSAQQSTCGLLGVPQECWKRSQVIPCVVQAGYCIEGSAGDFGDFKKTNEIYCE